MSAPHVIVVGAGIGGLSSALDLAARGARVTLFEQHDAPGGKMRQVDVGGRRIDSGPTVFTMRWIFDDLFAEAGLDLDEHLELVPADLLARHSWPDRSRLDLFADPRRTANAIREFSGAGEAEAYLRFAIQSGEIFDTLDLSFMRAQRPGPVELSARLGLFKLKALLDTKPFVTLWNELGRTFGDARLQQLFGRYATYCGSSPFLAPATLMLIAHAERLGVWYVRGGMQSLADTLAERAEAFGAELLFGEPVERILTYEGRASGVQLVSGDAVTADAVVFNGDTRALADGLLGDGVLDAVPRVATHEPSLSAVTWSMVAEAHGFPLAHHTVFFGDHYADEFDAVFSREDVTAAPTVYVCAQDRRDETAPAEGEPERLLCLVNAPAVPLDDDALNEAEARLIGVLANQGLSLSFDNGGAVRTGPGEFAAMFPATDGALYGRPTHGWLGSFRRPGSRARVKHLYFAGGSVHPGAGVPMTAMSGRLAAHRGRLAVSFRASARPRPAPWPTK